MRTSRLLKILKSWIWKKLNFRFETDDKLKLYDFTIFLILMWRYLTRQITIIFQLSSLHWVPSLSSEDLFHRLFTIKNIISLKWVILPDTKDSCNGMTVHCNDIFFAILNISALNFITYPRLSVPIIFSYCSNRHCTIFSFFCCH